MVRSSIAVLCLLCSFAAQSSAADPRAFAVEVSGSGTPVILIPGLACGADVWLRTVEHYRPRHQLHVLTLAGFAMHGREPAPSVNAPFLERVRVELAAYIRAQGLKRPIVVGHSLGGFLALWLAACEPTLLGGVIVVDALPYLGAAQDPTATVERTRPLAEQLRAQLGTASPAAFAVQNRAALATLITASADIEAVHRSSRLSDPKAVAQAVYEMMTIDLRPALSAIRVPTLVLIAGASPGASSEQLRAPFDAQYTSLPSARLLIATRARHFIMLDDASFFFSALDSFFARVAEGV
jgi:pimeloyl-ACP methyl ester carboxylesterase